MKTLFPVAVILFFLSTSLFAQTAATSAVRPGRPSATKDMMPSVEAMFGALSSDDGKKFSIKDTIKDMMAVESTEPIANTEESVGSAIEEGAELVVEEEIPAINLETAKPVDTKTKRYAPRLTIDFRQFPLRRVSRAPETSLVPLNVGDRLRSRLREDGIQVDFDENVVRLHGTVSSEPQRELAEIMLRFEPGVDRVRNELTVAEPGRSSIDRYTGAR